MTNLLTESPTRRFVLFFLAFVSAGLVSIPIVPRTGTARADAGSLWSITPTTDVTLDTPLTVSGSGCSELGTDPASLQVSVFSPTFGQLIYFGVNSAGDWGGNVTVRGAGHTKLLDEATFTANCENNGGKGLANILNTVSVFTYANTVTLHFSVGPPRADCYDINWQGLDSRPEAQYCATALNQSGYQATAHTNADSGQAFSSSPGDAIFYATGHALSSCPGMWGADKMVVDENATAASIGTGTESNPGFLAGPMDQDCLPQNSSVNRGWATPNGIGHSKLVVLQVCLSLKPTFTSAKKGETLVSIGQQAYDAGAGIVVGFKDEIPFLGAYGQFGTKNFDIPSQYRPFGDLWAHTFFAALQAGATVSEAALEAILQVEEYNFSGSNHGYQSLVIQAHPGAPDTLRGILSETR